MKTQLARPRWAVWIVALAMAFAVPASAQAPAGPVGKIVGRVLDRSGDPLPYASVTIPALKRGTATDENGNYSMPGVPVGSVSVLVAAIGYDKVTQTVQVTAGGTATLNFKVGEA